MKKLCRQFYYLPKQRFDLDGQHFRARHLKECLYSGVRDRHKFEDLGQVDDATVVRLLALVVSLQIH